jgi:hypothetical protein
MRRMFEWKRDQMIGIWRKLHNEELRNLYSSSSIITVIKSRRKYGQSMCHEWGKERNTNRILVGKTEKNIIRET